MPLLRALPLLALLVLAPSYAAESAAEGNTPAPEPATREKEKKKEREKKDPAFTFSAEDLERFDAWLSALREEALAQGISAATLDAALSGLRPIDRVIALDRRQPEGTMRWATYRSRVVTPARIETGRRLLAEHRALLQEVAKRHGVQPRFIVALWGIESSFGASTGGFSVIAALATLAFEGRRGAFFRRELLHALKILDEGHITPERMKGSWAGAMGQCQFMPSSFLSWAVDHDGDGRKDIWETKADVFASTANYLAKNRWNPRRTWGRRVRVPGDLDPSLIGRKVRRPLSEWQALGVRRANGADLPAVEIDASLVQPGGPGGPTYLVYDNYRVLLHWNRSLYFATAVGLLADAIGR